ncbi:hypothetical protein [Aneurinibacillus terranovensis]|uniref:hypothetical protein n=1 Tax=Aneurinibacillus terranovensis TaxID=278991 RepID=UPI00048323D5|nr:hypothetical protein [Aneurinibacillus terranovensis]
MCVLCGESVLNVHWTEKKRLNPDTDRIVGQFQRSRMRERNHRIKLTNQVLKHFGLHLEDWNGSKFLLRNNKGKTEIVHDLGSLWPAAEKLAGRALDPLDPVFLERFTS